MGTFAKITKEIQSDFETWAKENVEPTLDYGVRIGRYRQWRGFASLEELRSYTAQYFTKSESSTVSRLCDFSHTEFVNDVAYHSYQDFTVTCARTYEPQNLPDICGYLGRACRCMDKEGGANTAICMNCPLAKFAETKEQ